MVSTPEFRIGVLASGGGTTFEAVQLAIEAGELTETEIAFVVCNNDSDNPDAGVWERARRLDVDIHHISNMTQETCTVPIVRGEPVKGTISYEASDKLLDLAHGYDIDMLVALGFMRRVIGKTIRAVPIANTHPGPLPETAGKHGTGVQEEVMRQGLEFSGPTFHWMDDKIGVDGLPQYDSGAKIGHQTVRVTDEMKAEWVNYADDEDPEKKVKLLKAEVMRVEKLFVPRWIRRALEQL